MNKLLIVLVITLVAVSTASKLKSRGVSGKTGATCVGDECQEEVTVSAQDAQRLTLMKNLFAHAREHGATINVEPKIVGENNIALIASRDVPAGEPLTAIPSSVILFADEAREQLDHLFPGLKELSSVDTMALVLIHTLYHEDPFAKHYHYTMSLPWNYNYHPIMWSSDAVEELRGSFAFDAVKNQISHHERRYNYLKDMLVEQQANGNDELPVAFFTRERYFCAALAVSSRAWMVKDVMTSVPVADMYNHDYHAPYGSMNDQGTFFFINASSPTNAGDQVYVNYGPKNSRTMLETYGFVPDHFPEDFISITVNVNSQTSLQHFSLSLLEKHDDEYKVCKIPGNRASPNLIRLLRITNLKSFADVDHLDEIVSGQGFSIENDMLAYKAGLELMANMKNNFPGTSEDTAKLMETEIRINGHTNKAMALKLKYNEQMILEKQVAYIEQLWWKTLQEGASVTVV